MTNIHTKPGFYIGLVVLIFIVFILYQLYKLPDSFDVSNASFLGLGNTNIHYEKRGDKYYKRVTSSIAGSSSIGVETEITKDGYINAYKLFNVV